MNTFSVSCLALALAFGVMLTACSSTLPDQCPSDQTVPGTSSCLILLAKEAQNFDAQHYFASLTPGAAVWNPSLITLPVQPEFVVGLVGTQGVMHTMIQVVVDVAIIKCTNKCQYIAVMPGEYQGMVYVPAALGGITLYGTGEKLIDVKIGLSLDGGMSPADWCHDVNLRGKYMPGKPVWYMYDSCQSKCSDSIGVLCSVVFWSQNNGLQLQNLTIENMLGDSVDAGNHLVVALCTDGDQVQINNVNILGCQNTFFVTNSGVQNCLEMNCQLCMLVTNSYIEGDVDIVSGCGAVVFDNTEFCVVNSCTQQEVYVFALAMLSNIYYGFLAVNSCFNAFGDGVVQLGCLLDVDANTNGQVVICDSAINEGFNMAKLWADVVISNCLFVGNTGSVDDNDEIQCNLNDTNYNCMWEYNNCGVGSKVVAEAKK